MITMKSKLKVFLDISIFNFILVLEYWSKLGGILYPFSINKKKKKKQNR